MAFYAYIILNTKYYATVATWRPRVIKPSTTRPLLNNTHDATYATIKIKEWKGRIKAKVTPSSGYGSPSDLRTALETAGGISFTDHYGTSHTVHVQQWEEVSLLPDWDAAGNAVYFDVVLRGT